MGRHSRTAGNPKEPLKNERHEMFCHAFLVNFNLKKSALEAGYKGSSAHAMGYSIIKRPEVKARLQFLQSKFFKEKKLEREEVMQQLYYLCTRDVLDLTDDEGIVRVDDLRKLPLNLRAAIDGLFVKQLYDKEGENIGQTIEIRLSPKAKAVEMAMKHFSLFAPEKVDVKQTVVIDWSQMFKSMRDETPEIESQIKELPENPRPLVLNSTAERK